eukprot:79178_1
MTDIGSETMTDITTGELVLELELDEESEETFECILFYHTNIVAECTAEWSPNGRGCYAMLGRNGNKWIDGTISGIGTTCDFCENGETYCYSKAITACGNELKWEVGTVCALGITCKECKNDAMYWGGGTICGKDTTCHSCCSGNHNVHGPLSVDLLCG